MARSKCGGYPTGLTWVGAKVAGGRKLTTPVEVVDGAGIANFAFVGRSQLSGRVLAGTRPLSRMNVAVNPLHPRRGWSIRVQRARRWRVRDRSSPWTARGRRARLPSPSWATPPLTPVSGRTASRAGWHRTSGITSYKRDCLTVRTSRSFIAFSSTAAAGTVFDGLDPGDYVVTHSSPHYGEIIEVRIFGASVEDLDFNPTYERGLAIPVIDAESKEPLESAICEINEGPWAGTSFGLYKRERLRLPTALAHTDMTCTSEGYEPAHVRWGRRSAFPRAPARRHRVGSRGDAIFARCPNPTTRAPPSPGSSRRAT